MEEDGWSGHCDMTAELCGKISERQMSPPSDESGSAGETAREGEGERGSEGKWEVSMK